MNNAPSAVPGRLEATHVFVLNLGYSALGIARSLAPFGLSVRVFSSVRRTPFAASRHLRVITAPDSGSAEAAKLLRLLVEHARRSRYRPVLFPTRDIDVIFIDKHRTELGEWFHLPQADHGTLHTVVNKPRLLAKAEAFGLSIPKTVVLPHATRPAQLSDSGLRLPIIIKAAFAHEPHLLGLPVGTDQSKAHLATSWQDASSRIRYLHRQGLDVFVQDYVPGPAHQLHVCAGYLPRNGISGMAFTARKLVQHPLEAGIGRAVQTIEDPDLTRRTLAFLQHLGYCGLFEAEFKLDTDGVHRLIEINPRHWDQHILGSACGINVTLLALQDLLHEPAPASSYRFRHAIWLDDPLILRMALSRDQQWAEARSAIARTPRRPRRITAMFDMSDPLPAVLAYSTLTSQALRRLIGLS